MNEEWVKGFLVSTLLSILGIIFFGYVQHKEFQLRLNKVGIKEIKSCYIDTETINTNYYQIIWLDKKDQTNGI